jgi:hypothetical protein
MSYLIPDYARQIKRGIELSLSERLVLPTLILLYSGMDVFGALTTVSGRGGEKSFTDWASRYMAPFLGKTGLSATDLYSARCGVLHTGRATSDMVASGKARELWYGLGDDSHINLIVNVPLPPVHIRMEEMVAAFNSAIEQFFATIQSDPGLQQTVTTNAERYFRKVKLFGPIPKI